MFDLNLAVSYSIVVTVIALKDGGRAPLPKDRNADILVSRALVGRGSWLLRGTRDLLEEPMGFLGFTLEARVPTVLTNPCRRFAHVDVM